MLVRHALSWIRRRIVARLDEDDRLDFDAWLGDTAADAELQQRRREAIEAMGGAIA